MAVQTQVIRFAKDATDVDGATQDVNLNFTPKAVILLSDGNTVNNTVSAHYHAIMGLSDGTNACCVGSTSDDADAASDTATVYLNTTLGIFQHLDEVDNAVGTSRATIAFGTNKVTFTWAVNDANATLITLFAIGGDDITNVKVNTVDVGTTGTGTIDYTGLGFTPTDKNSVLFLLHRGEETAINSIIGGGNIGFGCAVSSSKRWSIANVLENAVDPSDTWRVISTDKCYTSLTTITGAIASQADFSAWITDGFRLNWTDAPTATTVKMSYIVIKGGTWDADTLTAPVAITNNVDYAVSVNSFPIRGLMLGTCSITTTDGVNVVQTNAIMSVGATDGTTQAHIGNIDEDGQATMDSYRINNVIDILGPLITNGARADIATFDSFSTNNFRLDWATKSASPILVPWVVVADQTAAEALPKEFGDTHLKFIKQTGGVGTIFG